jgi:hypothetical protein
MGYVMTTLALLEQYSRAGGTFDIQVRCAAIFQFEYALIFLTRWIGVILWHPRKDLTALRFNYALVS